MDSRLHEVAKGCIDHSLPLHTVHPGKERTFNVKAEVAFARRIIAAMPPMLLAVVSEGEAGWRKRRVEPREHFSRDGSGGSSVH